MAEFLFSCTNVHRNVIETENTFNNIGIKMEDLLIININ